ncbi:flotillin [Amphibacillus marinus]|uniref:Flotillin n=1 Tax=Amphibacillus marinus TaxID=872970 RepID=A0A1H8P315_9BACI|nr:flotillin family protein [Amphibacillus marinus]SEO36245.1 flotillin [Amphibacillus marinus]
MDFSIELIIGGVVLGIIFLAILVYIAKYKTVGPDEALIVTGNLLGSGSNVVDSGDGKKIKIIRGGGTFVVPVFQRAEPLSLLNHKLEVGTTDTYTKQGVPVTVNGVSIIKVGSTIEDVSTAAEQYLGKTREELRNEAKEVLEGHLRAILSSMTVEDIYSNREEFAQGVFSVAQKDLSKMGLKIVSFTIKEISDKNGYLEALGQPQISTVKRDAQIAKAEREKEARIENARAEQEAKTAEFQRDAQIAESGKEKELKIAEYRRQQDSAKAEADQAYQLQEAIAKQKVTEQRIQVDIIERQKQIELEEKEIARREKQYDAEVKKKADADRYAVEQAAEANKAKELRSAEAHRFKIEQEGIALAEAEKAKGFAEADVIRQQGLAEAEAKAKIAEAFDLYGQAAIMDMVLDMLPLYAKEVAKPLGNIDKITVVDTGGSDGKNSGAGKVSGYATDLMATVQETLKASSGIDVKSLLESYVGKDNVRESIDQLNEELSKDEKQTAQAEATTSVEEA